MLGTLFPFPNPAAMRSPEDSLIVAFDVPEAADALKLLDRLEGTTRWCKIGLELAMAPGFFELLAELKRRQQRVFVDIKFFDIPETVARAVANLARAGADMCTVHGNQSMMEAAATAKGPLMKLMAVTALTSIDAGDLEDMGFACDVAALVESRSKRALAAGCDGVVSSGLEVARLKNAIGPKLLCLTPGIRPVENRVEADQKRIVTPGAAMTAGADYLVVGRPIRDAADPAAATRRILADMAAAMSGEAA